MKNFFKIFGIIAILAVIGFSMASCDNDPALEITTETLPDGVVGTAYSQTLTAEGEKPITWSIDDGTLPAGLTLAEKAGVISGTPTTAMLYTFTVKATNAKGNDTKQLTIAIANVSTGGGSGTGGGGTGGGGSNTPGSTSDNAILVTVGNSSSHTISSSGENWFKFTGTGDPVIFETTGGVVDTYMEIWDNNNNMGWYNTVTSNDNSGKGNNALCSLTTTSDKTYWIKVTAGSSTSGTYTFVVKSPTSNLRSNPITVSVGNSSSHTIFSSGTHWFKFTGTGDRVFFETEGDVVNTNLSIYIGDNTYSSNSKQQGDKGTNFFTVSGTTYYINITGNSGTYTFIVRNGTGDGSSAYNAKEVTKGYSSSHTITSSGEHWFIYNGTGNSVTFKTTGDVVDTYMEIWNNYGNMGWYNTVTSNDNSGDGNNALCNFTTTSGTTYWIKITAGSSTSGTYTFIVE